MNQEDFKRIVGHFGRKANRPGALRWADFDKLPPADQDIIEAAHEKSVAARPVQGQAAPTLPANATPHGGQ